MRSSVLSKRLNLFMVYFLVRVVVAGKNQQWICRCDERNNHWNQRIGDYIAPQECVRIVHFWTDSSTNLRPSRLKLEMFVSRTRLDWRRHPANVGTLAAWRKTWVTRIGGRKGPSSSSGCNDFLRWYRRIARSTDRRFERVSAAAVWGRSNFVLYKGTQRFCGPFAVCGHQQLKLMWR